MVAISISSTKGNAGARWFPHSGHLGFTPVKLDGIVRTRMEEDGKPVAASALTISLRCYEAQHGRVGVVKTNIIAEQTQTLWTPPNGTEYGPLGAREFPFRLVLPVNAPGSSTFHLQDYRIYWRLEAAIHTAHVPGIGSRQVKCFDVNLVRYSKPSISQRPVAASSLQPCQFSQCEFQFPRRPTSPLDPIPLSLRIQPHTGASLQRVTFALERRIDFIDSTPASSSSHLASPSSGLTRSGSRESSPGLEPYSSTVALLNCPPGDLSLALARKRSPSPASQCAKSIEAVLASTEVTDIPKSIMSDKDTPYTVSAMLQVPIPKSGAHWGVGETMQGELARVRFFVTVKAQLATGGNSVVVDLGQEEIIVIAVDDAERQRVHSKYSMKRPATSPSTENQEEHRRPVPHLPSPPPSPDHLAVPTRFGKSGKRPHTSSGTRDPSQRRTLPLRPRSRGNEATMPVPTALEPEQFRAWERELDRIAPASQQRPRSSSGLKIFGSKKRRSPEPPSREDFLIGVARTVTVPSVRTAEVLEWEAEVERFSSASAREAVLQGRRNTRTSLSV
ncbi:unnamed protein product [Rhizoctonia solani]|uniref:Uncharacterized protein n=1 Tax=Rhizoctonia solani TaxID=456999 RepID=A0A8H3DV80_9AGAM|nr:unnamed protein product [Rhizoctonia solani]